MDWFQEQGAKLAQPKRQVAEYVRQATGEEVLVPQIFPIFEDSPKDAYVRSECWLEYAHFSGLLDSLHGIDESILHTLLEQNKGYIENGDLHDYLLAQQMKDVKERDMSLSFWEKIKGKNHFVVADDAAPDRFHVGSLNERLKKPNYHIVQSGTIKEMAGYENHVEEQRLEALIKSYQRIRELDRFDPENCPVMEFQSTEEGDIYFLQYHKGRQSNPSKHRITGHVEGTQAPFVRGASDKEGFEIQLAINTEPWKRTAFPRDVAWIHHGRRDQPGWEESYVRSSKALVLELVEWKKLFLNYPGDHQLRTALFMPEVSIALDHQDKFVSRKEMEEADQIYEETGVATFVPIHIVSDGTTAYINRLD